MLRCAACSGKGEVMGLGLMMKKCDVCKGTGWILEDSEIEVEKEIALENKQYVKDASVSRSERMRASWAKRKAKNEAANKNPAST